MATVIVGTHTIEARNSPLGIETVSYGGQVESKSASLRGCFHHFTVEEDGQRVTYEVRFKVGFTSTHIAVRRDGTTVFHD